MTDQLIPSNTLATVRLSGHAVEEHAVPAGVLIRVLSGMQQLVYIVASDSGNRKLVQRFRVADDIERDYKLMCKVPEPGSYSLPLSLEPRCQQLRLLPDESVLISLSAS